MTAAYLLAWPADFRGQAGKPILIDLKPAVDVARGALEIGNAAETHLH